MKVMVNTGKTVSWKGSPIVGGRVIDIPDDRAKDLIQRGLVSDPAKPKRATPAELAMAEFKANPPVPQSKSEGDDGKGGDGKQSVDDAVKSLLP